MHCMYNLASNIHGCISISLFQTENFILYIVVKKMNDKLNIDLNDIIDELLSSSSIIIKL